MASLDAILGRLRRVTSWAIDSARHRGVRRTVTIAASVVEDTLFDWRFGTETSRVVDSREFEASLVNRRHAVSYQATKARPFQDLLRRMDLPDGRTFVDVGSGKGRVLLLAAQHPFTRVVGIEFSPSLCAQARRNIEIFRARVPALAPIEICEGDVTGHPLRGDEDVFFLYHPFDAVVLGHFVDNLRRSLDAQPRQVWLIYSVPLHAAVLDASGLFVRCVAYRLRGHDFHVYTNGRPG